VSVAIVEVGTFEGVFFSAPDRVLAKAAAAGSFLSSFQSMAGSEA